MEFVTRGELAADLGVTARSVDRLVAVGLLPAPTKIGAAQTWEKRSIAHVTGAVLPVGRPPAVMAKVKERHPASSNEIPPSRKFVGWDKNLNPLDPCQIDGVNRWWTVKDAEKWIGDSFIVSAIGFVLAVYSIVDVNTVQGLRHFILDAPTEEGRIYEGTRFPSERGAIMKSWR